MVRTEAALAAFIPSVVFLGIVYTRDRYEREPKLLIARLYVMSVLACAVAIVLESALRIDLTGSVATVVISAIGVGLIEEEQSFGVVVLATPEKPTTERAGRWDGLRLDRGPRIRRHRDVSLHPAGIRHRRRLSPHSRADAASIALTSSARASDLGEPGPHGMVGDYRICIPRRRLKLGGRFQLLCAYLAAALLHAVYDGTLSLNAPTLAYTSLAFSLVVYVHLFRHSLAASPFRRQQLRPTPLPPPSHHPAMATAAGAGAGIPTHAGAPSPPPMFVPDAVIPAGGLAVWAHPDASSRLIGRLEPGTGVQTLDRLGTWAHVLSPLGWSGWIDGRVLVSPPIAPPR